MSGLEAAFDDVLKYITNPHADFTDRRQFGMVLLDKVRAVGKAAREEERAHIADELAALAAIRATRVEIELFPYEGPLVFYSGTREGAACLKGWIAGVREERRG